MSGEQRRVVVTGATGFIGGHCATDLAVNHEVVAVGRRLDALNELADRATIQVEQLDLTREGAARTLGAHNPDVIVHAAALSSPWGRPADFAQANVAATKTVIDACEQSDAALVFLSTPTIYMDRTDRTGIDEDAPLPAEFINDYSATKYEAEQQVRASSIRSIVLRPQAVIGAGDTTIAPRFLRVIERGLLPSIRGCDPLIDMTHVSNVVAAIELAIGQMQQDTWNGSATFNITNGDPRRLSELLDLVLQTRERFVGESNVRKVQLPRPVLAGVAGMAEAIGKLTNREPTVTGYSVELLTTSRTLDIGRAREQLGYDPSKFTVEQALFEYFADRFGGTVANDD